MILKYYREFKQLDTYQKLKVVKFFLILIAFSLGSTQFTGVPVIFYRPPKIESIDQDIENSTPQFDSQYPGIFSIPMEYDLYGENEIYEVIILTLAYSCKVLALTFLVFYPIKQSQVQFMFITPIIATGIALSSLSLCSTLPMLGLTFCVWYGGFSFFYGQMYQYVATQFEGQIAEYGVFYLNTTWSVFLLLHIIFMTQFGSWRTNVIYFIGFSYLIVGFCFLFVQRQIEKIEKQELNAQHQQDINNRMRSNSSNSYRSNRFRSNSSNSHKYSMNQSLTPSGIFISSRRQSSIFVNYPRVQVIHDESAEKTTVGNMNFEDSVKQELENEQTSFEMLRDIYNEIKNNKLVRQNMIIWCICWSVCDISYIGGVLALNRLKGDLFFNMFVSTIFELVGNFFSLYLIKNFNIKSVITNNLYIIGISYASLLLFNPGSVSGDIEGQEDKNSYASILISVFPVLIAKATHETMWNIMIEFQKYVIDIKYHQFNFSIANLYNILIDSTLPYYQYQMEQIGMNQFIGYGFYTLFAAFVSRNFKVTKPQEQKEEVKQSQQNNSSKNQNGVELQTLKKNLLDAEQQ